MDSASNLLSQFGVHAGTFHSGTHCGIATFGEPHTSGHIHLLRKGRIRLILKNGSELDLGEPSLIFFPTPYHHRIIADQADNAEIVCASLHFVGGAGNPLTGALPGYIILPIAKMPYLGNTLEWLFEEAFSNEYGHSAVTDRLFELVIIQLIRQLLKENKLGQSVLAGLADPRISKVLNLMHTRPQQPFSVDEMAEAANMSRASFAAYFKSLVGKSPADYLVDWRITLVQKRLGEGASISIIAGQVGYDSPSALARAFRRKIGVSPREWLSQQSCS